MITTALLKAKLEFEEFGIENPKIEAHPLLLAYIAAEIERELMAEGLLYSVDASGYGGFSYMGISFVPKAGVVQ